MTKDAGSHDPETALVRDSARAELTPQPPPSGELPPSNGAQVGRVGVVSMTTSSPLPPPDWMERYEKIAPGAANLLLNQFVGETAHRQALEKEELQIQAQDLKAQRDGEAQGRKFSLILGILLLVVVTVIVPYNPVAAASLAGGGLLTGIVGNLASRRAAKNNAD